MFAHMQQNGVTPSIVTFTSLARAFARCGEWTEVEKIGSAMDDQGIAMNDYFLNVLLSAYATARPRQLQRAEAAFRSACKSGVVINEYVKNSLSKCLGKGRAAELIHELDLEKPSKLQRSVQARRRPDVRLRCA